MSGAITPGPGPPTPGPGPINWPVGGVLCLTVVQPTRQLDTAKASVRKTRIFMPYPLFELDVLKARRPSFKNDPE